MKKAKKAAVKARDSIVMRALKWYFRQVSDGWRIFLKLVAFYSGVVLAAFVFAIIISFLLVLL